MKDFKLQTLIIFTMIYGLFSILTFLFITGEGLSVWMGINVGFAMIPLILIVFLYQRFIDQDKKIDWILILGLIIFVFFYPNSFYILTDFIHIDSIDFYTTELYQGATYLEIIDPYLMLFHIIISAMIGAFVGIQSLLYLEKMFDLKYNNKVLTYVVVVIMLLLSSTGIYIGRFLRFFSWDILRPITLLTQFFSRLDLFVIAFIFFFTLLELAIYYGYKYLIIRTPNK